MTYKEAIEIGERRLLEAGIADAKNDAWLLLAMVCRIDHTYYYMHMAEELPEETVAEFEAVLKKRAERIPLQYITGEQDFMGLPFHVDDSVLIPRQDTETLVEQALKLAAPGMKVMDMCTGSGCVLISVLKHAKGLEGYGYDISKKALNVAKENARRNDVSAEFERSNLFEDVKEKDFDMILSNPPYIPTDVIATLMPEVASYEPFTALDGHEDGLYFYREIAKKSRDFLKQGGFLLLEIGNDQASAVTEILEKNEFSRIQVVQDLARNDRVIVARKRG